ncbi:MAG: V-type ATPase 116kDa subunit family protein [Schaedlerella sp.]|nr:V-type ATPase 116kDa subunit family protein [Schaedlerella sp.]
MIVKMRFLNISGPVDDIDRITDQYLSKYEIHLESAMSELKTTDILHPFTVNNPYRNPLTLAERFVSLLDKPEKLSPSKACSLEDMLTLIDQINEKYTELLEKKDELKKELNELKGRLAQISPFAPLDYDLKEIQSFQYINYHFGRLPVELYGKLQKYLLRDLNAIFLRGAHDETYQYGIYFVSSKDKEKSDAIFRMLEFEDLKLNIEFDGTPDAICAQLHQRSSELTQQLNKVEAEIKQLFANHSSELLAAKNHLEVLANNHDIRKLAAYVIKKEGDFYVLCGWMPETDANKFIEECKDDKNITVIIEEDDDDKDFFGEPPTKLKNPKILKPYELYIKMYGLPAHNEIDPTIFVGLTYSFIFGAMFGDVGQGLVLAIGGFLLYKLKHMALAGIIATAGVFSTFFGFMFGSIFGFEDVIDAVWLHPMTHMTILPFIGRLNTVFIVAVAFGMFLIIVAMILHIINGFKSHDVCSTWFDVNGVISLVFYGSVVLTVVLFMTGNKVPGAIFMIIMFGAPLLVLLFKEQLTNKVLKKKEKMEEGIGMFLLQGFFELFETVLSYFSNTLSFVRVGAFAVSHAAMMEVVLMLAGATDGNPNWFVVVLGNIFVCGLEGLIVGIQVLRLEYYEMFSRFYKGSGREFTPYVRTLK